MPASPHSPAQRILALAPVVTVVECTRNPKADAAWANRLFQYDSNSISGEVLWQVGYQLYIVTNGKDKWVTDVKGTPKFRGAFSSAVPTPAPR